jgi:hypothetical protein
MYMTVSNRTFYYVLINDVFRIFITGVVIYHFITVFRNEYKRLNAEPPKTEDEIEGEKA